MGAVVEATLRRELGDVGESAVDVPLPYLQLAEPGRVDDDRAAGQYEQLAVPVVCRPRPSRRRSPVSMTVRPASRFTSVDFPVPEEPSRTKVFAGRSRARTSSMPSPVTLLTAKTGTPTAMLSASSSFPGSSQTSSS